MEKIHWPALEIVNPYGAGSIALLCEHASSFIPSELDQLGLSKTARFSHAAWDIGAKEMGCRLAARLDAPLICATISRLVYDCNRPLEARDAIPEKSEVIEVPGNTNLSEAERKARFDAVHEPFHKAVTKSLDQFETLKAVITLHSFTPIYNGVKRSLDIGFLHDSDDQLARLSLQEAQKLGGYGVALNAPYDSSDGVTYSLRKHGVDRKIPNVMIEVRNDLISDVTGAQKIADYLYEVLIRALKHIPDHRNTQNENA